MTINDAKIDILSRLEAMRVHEKTTRCFNYFKGIESSHGGDVVDEPCRAAMVTWIRQVHQTLSLDPETVWIAFSFLDRYLSSGKGESQQALHSKRKFQLVAITAYYTAIKIYEPAVLSMGMLLRICRGIHSETDIISMEREILKALDWRGLCHTPMDFIRDLLQLLPESLPSKIPDSILADCQKHLDDTITDVRFSFSRPSDVGISCLASSLAENRMLSLSEERAIWVRLSMSCQCAQSLKEVVAARQDLILDLSICKRSAGSKLAALMRQSYGMYRQSSPICVTKAALQA